MKATAILFSLALLISVTGCAQTKKSQRSKTPTKIALIKDVHKYIVRVQKHHDGYLPVYDSVTKKNLKLKLTKVHNDKFASMGNNTYFVCSDFNGTDGNKYDIDTFMKWNGKTFKATSRKVHKVNGKARYTWYKDGDVWKTRKANGKSKSGVDHPGH